METVASSGSVAGSSEASSKRRESTTLRAWAHCRRAAACTSWNVRPWTCGVAHNPACGGGLRSWWRELQAVVQLFPLEARQGSDSRHEAGHRHLHACTRRKLPPPLTFVSWPGTSSLKAERAWLMSVRLTPTRMTTSPGANWNTTSGELLSRIHIVVSTSVYNFACS